MSDQPSYGSTISRKYALGILGSIGGAVTLAQCSGGGSSIPTTSSTATPVATATPIATATISPTPAATAGVNATPTATAIATARATATATAKATATATGSTTTAACAAVPEGEIGPYFADDSASGFDRSNVTANIDGSDVQTGVPFTLTLTVVDTEKSCAPYVGAQIDIWHCNATGVYSDISSENTSAQTYLRGYQLTNSSGVVQFTTIVPGWYQGRTHHIHVRVRSTYSEASSTSDGTNTTQVFFPQDVTDYLSTNVAPYNTKGVDPTTNASDRVYAQQTQGKTLLTLSGSPTSGYSAAFTIGLPIGG